LTTGRASREARRAGFTLLELVLVMVIICTVLGATSASLRGFFVSRRTDDTAARIVSLARLARSMAVSEGRPYRLVFDVPERVFYLTAREQGGFRRPRTGLGRAFVVPDGADLELRVGGAGRDFVTFYPEGLAEPATIRLTDIKGGLVEVSCLAPTEPFAVTSQQEAG
jgi:type II secretion system protein H